MEYNLWISLLILSFGSCLVYCVKKEYFENKITIHKTQKIKDSLKYNLFEVNKCVDAINEYFGEKDKVRITITRVLNIYKTGGSMILNLFIYNPIKNVMLGYTIKINIPVNKNEKYKIESVSEFSEKEEDEVENLPNQENYQKLSLKDGKFL